MISINALAASEHARDLRRAADAHRAGSVDPAATDADMRQTIALRLAHDDETALVARLADLDDAPALRGRVLVAFADGEAIAALSLADGRVVANPFVCTVDAVALLRLREQHLQGPAARRGWRAVLHPRLALR